MNDNEIIQALVCCIKSKSKEDCEALNCPCFKECHNIAISALEKQIPKKPVKTRSEIVCPICNTLVGSSPYCRYCGQAIDWSDSK